MNVTPKGFTFKAVSAGIRYKGRPDLALIVSDRPAAAAAVFTTNRVQAAPVKLSKRRVARGEARAIVVNAGNANACTGPRGREDARAMADITGAALGLKSRDVLVASTGVIGEPLPMDRVSQGILGAALAAEGTLDDLADSIRTTDTVRKVANRRIRIGGKRVHLAGVAKGSGMIAPNMATMLAFVVTDAAVRSNVLDEIFRKAADRSFNRITVDGDCSTNDTAMILANGAAGHRPLGRRSPELSRFEKALGEILSDLSRMIARDGEGARHLIEVEVRGAVNAVDAEKSARAIADSLLVKTAVTGRDANWGRIVCAAGYSGARIDEEKVDVLMNRVKIVSRGRPTGRDEEAAEAMSADTVRITLNLRLGKASAEVLTCDLTEKYIEINAEYRS